MGLAGLLVLAGLAVQAELAPKDFADPLESLRRSAAPLNLVEQFLEVGERDAVRAYYEQLLEDGKLDAANRVRCVQELYSGNYAGALQALEILSSQDAWATTRAHYAKALADVQSQFAESRSDHFIFRVSSDDIFLAQYALPALEAAYAKISESLGGTPPAPIVVEVYPTPESFSFATTLPAQAIERAGAVGVCKFGRLMILSPQATPMGYRWLDSLVHEFTHMAIQKASHGFAPLWLHEGTARFWDTAWRRPGGFALPVADEALLAGAVQGSTEAKGLVPFSRMEPSFVNLPDQRTVALAYAETADAVAFMAEDFGAEKNRQLLAALASLSRPEAFLKTLGVSEEDFEKAWRESLVKNPGKAAQGALGQTIRLKNVDELSLAGVDAQGHIRLGDRLRQQNQPAAALAQYKKAAELEPNNGVVLARLARGNIAMGRLQTAEKILRQAMETNPSYVTPFVMLGDMLFDDGRYEEAQTVLQGALEINPFHPKIHEVLGLIAVDLGQFPKARQSLQLALRLDAGNEAARQALDAMPKNR